MIRFEGDRQVPLPPADAWRKLRDARFLVDCIQGAQATGADATADVAHCRVRPNVPFLHGTMELTVRVAEAEEPSAVRVVTVGQGNNASSEVETWLTLTEKSGGTHIHWTADVRALGGLLKMAPAVQVQAAAQKLVNETWGLVAQKIGK